MVTVCLHRSRTLIKTAFQLSEGLSSSSCLYPCSPCLSLRAFSIIWLKPVLAVSERNSELYNFFLYFGGRRVDLGGYFQSNVRWRMDGIWDLKNHSSLSSEPSSAPAVWPWGNCLTFPNLNLSTCRVEFFQRLNLTSMENTEPRGPGPTNDSSKLRWLCPGRREQISKILFRSKSLIEMRQTHSYWPSPRLMHKLFL